MTKKQLLILGIILLVIVISTIIIIVVKDGNGDSISELQKPPEAKASATPIEASINENISFSGVDSTDLDGTIVSYEWDFGDGTTASGSTVSHAYSAAGSFDAELTVTDNDGLSDTDEVTVMIETGIQEPPTDGLQANVLGAEKTNSVNCGDVTIDSREGFVVLSITIALENSSKTSLELTLTPENTLLRDGQQREYSLEVVGVVYKGSSRCLYGTSGQMNISPVGDESWKLTGDFTNNMWIVTLDGGSRIEMLIIYNVPADASGLRLLLPGFAAITLES